MVTPKLVFIQAGGPQLGADLYLPPSAAGPVPAVVTGSGFGGVKEMLLPHFARALAAAGVATLAIDYAGFGASAGEPRQDLDPEAQIRDLRRGLDYLAKDPRIDATRLGAFGPSMCGAHVLVLAGSDPRVRVAVSLVPFVRSPRTPPNPRLGRTILLDVVRSMFGLRSQAIAAAGLPGERAVMTSDGALDWISMVSANAPSFRNQITVRSLVRLARYRPMRQLGPQGIRIPLRTILSRADGITPASEARAELRGVSHDCVEFEGTHFELFGEHLPEVTRLTVEWLVEHLAAKRSDAQPPQPAAG
ncbi:MAG TPA: alpha/beta hydrolase [Polyangiales bacterium]|nr:alpha/beta hydrolase [Polyangiales bacterium]